MTMAPIEEAVKQLSKAAQYGYGGKLAKIEFTGVVEYDDDGSSRASVEFRPTFKGEVVTLTVRGER